MIIFNALQATLSGGIGRYCYELSKELYKINSDIKVVIREEDRSLFQFLKEEDMIIIKGINSGAKRNFFEQFKLPFMIHKMYPNATVHYPDSMAPLFSKNKVVITIHDIAFRALKDVFTWKTRVWKNLVTYFSIKKATRIIAISEYTKEEIIKYYGDDLRKKIDVVYNGFNDFSSELIELDEVRQDIRSLEKDKYILTVSTISPRKNINCLIRAYLHSNMLEEYKLVIAGGKGWLYEEVFNLVESLNLKDKIIFTDRINDEELKFLYKNCDVFTYISFYEGFGLPPLEAMSYGKPCIVSNVSSIPEVVGDSALKVTPYDYKVVADELIKLCKSKDQQKIYADLGIKNIKRFSWESCAKESNDIYNKF
ncbi:MAG: glycosyltransferase family 1 protein [Clostridium sp.]|uniref:glycosyltransferase family 4 protein n=1 Tax=Clostridium TaxID=1485 RepID=UPI0028FDC5DD|nr:glycosyltransferase family 1 protein [Clostridium sp.]MDU1278875.1 glycosyltransferase family 1 protein [Clostridium sp.]MDU7087508.1 glycosyltransferase family 1 protein [Clostridium sp.]